MVTDQQVRRLIELMQNKSTKSLAAAKAGMTRKTAGKYLRLNEMPSQLKKPHFWRTRQDPFEEIWGTIEAMLEVTPALEATPLFGHLQRTHPGRFPDGQLRTLQRRMRSWRAIKGPAKEVFFPQVHIPGELSESDFTHMTALGVTIRGVLFEHLLYHFVLTYSNWETGTICFSESFEALAEGYQNAVWELGRVPKKHRTDRMTAAVNKECNSEKFTQSYSALLRHYNAQPERTNPASANENGDIEQRHYRLKRSLAQALMIRGSADFDSRGEYEAFLRGLLNQLNSNRREKLSEELSRCGNLPDRKLTACKTIDVSVDQSSTIHVQKNTYSVHSRLIGERVRVKIYAERLELLYGQTTVDRIPRLKGSGKHHINYRHIIEWLVRKPGAFKSYRYQAEMFPSSYFRMAYDDLKSRIPMTADKEYVRILHIAAHDGEAATEAAIRQLLSRESAISAISVRGIVSEQTNPISITDVKIDIVDLAQYDMLLAEPELEMCAHG